MSVFTVIHYLPAETGFVRASLGLPSFAILSLQLTTYG